MFGGAKSFKHNVRTTLRFNGDSRISKVEGHFGAKEKVGGQRKCLYCRGIFYVKLKELEREFETQLGGPAKSPPRPPLESPLLQLAYRSCKNLTHTSKICQVQSTQLVATARFTIRVLVTFSDY